MLELALHAIPENLKSTVYSKVKAMAPHSGGILLFYGLCGSVLEKSRMISGLWAQGFSF